MSALDDLLELQSGVVTRRQLLDLGLAGHDVRRMCRRRELSVVTPGVYVHHTGPLTWRQRAWAAVLALEPAALCHASAIRAIEGPGRRDQGAEGVIHVGVDRHRSVSAPAGVRLHQLSGLDAKVIWSATPPRVRVEEALLDVATEAKDDLTCISRLAGGVQARLTTPGRLRAALATRRRIARRELVASVLAALDDGTESALEHRYLIRVERAHGLPTPERQTGLGGRRHDLRYPDLGVVVELDGRLFHDTAESYDADLERDLDSAVDGDRTIRLGWAQVVGRPCTTARKLGSLLRAAGWEGEIRPCPSCARPSVAAA